MTEKDPSLDELLHAARNYTMSPQERAEQRISFAYGNVAIEDPCITKADVYAAAQYLSK